MQKIGQRKHPHFSNIDVLRALDDKSYFIEIDASYVYKKSQLFKIQGKRIYAAVQEIFTEKWEDEIHLHQEKVVSLDSDHKVLSANSTSRSFTAIDSIGYVGENEHIDFFRTKQDHINLEAARFLWLDPAALFFYFTPLKFSKVFHDSLDAIKIVFKSKNNFYIDREHTYNLLQDADTLEVIFRADNFVIVFYVALLDGVIFETGKLQDIQAEFLQ